VNWDEMAVVGRVARPHGIRGQVVVNPDTDFPESRFAVGAALFVNRGGRVEPVRVTSMRIHQGRPIVGLEGIADMNAARALAGLEFRVPIDALAELPDGTFYRHDLVGCAVQTGDGTTVGTVSEVEGEMGNTRLVVTTDTGGEVLVPLVEGICRTIDPGAKRIVIAPPEGLLDVNERGR
jgi:16S rRNA processing protein RimM